MFSQYKKSQSPALRTNKIPLYFLAVSEHILKAAIVRKGEIACKQFFLFSQSYLSYMAFFFFILNAL